ncbi:MAG: 30S ribosomal protein S6 [Chloroflexi bacterium]|nr:30S ribosomal protein S6 [Chloroflexota bacterium]
MRRYELMLLLRPDLEDDKLQSAVEKVTRAIVNAGGSLSKVSPWGKRRLAYDIQRHREASYFLIHFDIEPSAVREIERGMLISEEILRHLVTVIEDRGPADELAPAAVARDADADGEQSTAAAPAERPTATATAEPAAADAASGEPTESEPVAEEAAPAEPASDEPVASADSSDEAEPSQAAEAQTEASAGSPDDDSTAEERTEG